MVSIPEERLRWLEGVRLSSGSHDAVDAGACVIEAAAYIAGEEWSDHPSCVSPIIAAFLRGWNDSLDDEDRQRLKPYVRKVIGTRASEIEAPRGWLVVDWYVRQQTPIWLESDGLKEQADLLRQLPEVVSLVTCQKASEQLGNVASAVDSVVESATSSAPRSIINHTIWSAANSAARRAALHALESEFVVGEIEVGAIRSSEVGAIRNSVDRVIWSATRNTAKDAVESTAWNTITSALRPTVVRLQESAFGLLDRMIALSEK